MCLQKADMCIVAGLFETIKDLVDGSRILQEVLQVFMHTHTHTHETGPMS